MARLAQREWTIDVEQTAAAELTVINGGDIVATFNISLEGVDASWFTISPPQVNLYEGGRATVSIAITPPRLPSSTAGAHRLAVVITSPNYPGRVTRLGAVLTINRYLEFGVGELSPRQQTVSWRRRTGQVTVPITNKGNGDTGFRLTAEDDERACSFEFNIPGEQATLVKQAEMRLASGGTYPVPITVTPIHRKLVALRGRSHSYTVTVTMAEGDQIPRSLMGQVRSTPLIGPWLILLALIGMVALLVFQFRPNPEPLLTLEAASPVALGPVSRAPGHMALLRVDITTPTPTPAVDAGAGISPTPAGTTGEALAAGVAVTGTQPVTANGGPAPSAGLSTTALFTQTVPVTTSKHITTVTLSYAAQRFPGLGPANIINRLNGLFLKLTLEYQPRDGAWQVAKTSSEINSLEGKIIQAPPDSGRYRLRASNLLAQLVPMLEGVSREVPVNLTPVEPKILKFAADRPSALVGQTVTVYWQVSDAETLTLTRDGVEETLKDEELARGLRSYTLDKDATFALVATNKTWNKPVKMPLTVKVNVPTPTPVPPPVIVRFDVAPLSIFSGEPVKIGWEVTGADSVSIDHLGEGLPLKGDMSDQPVKSTSYHLTAIKNGADGVQIKTSSLLKEVEVKNAPTPTPTPAAPVVQLFDIVPKQLVRGDGQLAKLTWAVTGATTNVEIAGSDFTLTGLKSQDFISLTLQSTTLVVLTAYNGELKTSKAVEVTVLEPTPLPTATPPPTPAPPTPTPIPPPIISFFTAASATGADDTVTYAGRTDSGGTPVFTYEVEAGSAVRFNWEVKNAEKVSLVGYEDQPAIGSKALTIVAPNSYQLIAENAAGKNKVSTFIQIKVRAPKPPPAPSGATGTTGPAGNAVSWYYDQTATGKIVGFRIYRGGVTPHAGFAPVQTIQDPMSRTWVDPVSPTCGKVYYVVALYMDVLAGVQQETAASATSWYTTPCP